MSYRIDFGSLPWESPMPGVRHKVVVVGDRRLRLVTYTAAEMPSHWCERGHVGQLLEGELQLEFADQTIVYRPGDGVTIPNGKEHAHRATALTPTATALFVEDA